MPSEEWMLLRNEIDKGLTEVQIEINRLWSVYRWWVQVMRGEKDMNDYQHEPWWGE